MPNKSKQFKKFASSGKLKETIDKRRKNQQIRRKADDRQLRRTKQRGAPKEFGSGDEGEDGGEDGDEDDAKERRGTNAAAGGRAGGVAKNVVELFGTGGLEGVDNGEGSDLEDLESGDEDTEDDQTEGGESMEDEDLELSEEAMKKAMKDLEKKDPEFFKYLKENDGDLLEFGKGKSRAVARQDSEDEDVDMDGEADEGDEDEDEDDENEEEQEEKKISVTGKMIRQWQEGMIKQHSLRSLRKTILAFRTAAHMNEDDADQGSGLDTKYRIDSAQVFNKIVITALKFTPVVVSHHLPYRTLPNGKIKMSPPKTPNPSLNRLLLSHFSTLLHLIKSLPSTPSSVQSTDQEEEDAGGLLLMAVGESTKLLPWIMGARKHVRAYLKVLLDLWSSAGDNVRIASFLAIRTLFVQGDDAIKDICLRNTYRSLLPPLRNTSPHTLPSINLMKNTASELYLLSPTQGYQHAFTFIRMLAVHLRSVVRSSTSGKGGENQEAFRAVYNWQFVHALDFWSRVLGGACSIEAQREKGGLESVLKPLIYPLTQVALGVVRLLPSSRYFPLRFHILHSLIRLISQTNTYIPLAPFLLEILDSSEFKKSNPKKSTLKPLDFEYIIRAPASYQKTRIFQESISDELIFLLGEYHASPPVSSSIAFPELVLPVITMMKRHIKKGSAGSPKCVNALKGLLEKLEAQRTLVESKRRGVGFAPRDRSEVARFEETLGEGTGGPLVVWMRLQRKVRDAKRREVERALREEREQSDDEE